MIISLICISESLIDPQDRARMLDNIRAVATDRNSITGISGLLVASPHYFAHLIEGPRESIDALMTRIATDPRHTALRELPTKEIVEPRGLQWRLVRYDQGNFGCSIVDPILLAAHAGNAPAIGRLDNLIAAVLHRPARVTDHMQQA